MAMAVDVAADTIQQADPAPGEKDGENTPRCCAPIFQVGSFKPRSGAAAFHTCTSRRRLGAKGGGGDHTKASAGTATTRGIS